MYVIHENELVHVDTGSDVLEHYGVKGIKWGKDTKVTDKLDYKKKFNDLKRNKYKKADAKSKGLNKQLDKAYEKQEAAYDNLSKNSKLRNYLTKDGRKQRAEAKKEYRKIDNSDARKQYKLDKKMKDNRKNATTGLRY